MDVHPGQAFFDAFDHRGVEVTSELGMDPTLECDLGSTPIPGLLRQPDDAFERDQIGLFPQVETARAFGEGAEPAAEIALVGVVDVAIDDVCHRVTDPSAPKLIGSPGDRFHLLSASTEEQLNFCFSGSFALKRPFEDGKELPSAFDLRWTAAGHPSLVDPLRR